MSWIIFQRCKYFYVLDIMQRHTDTHTYGQMLLQPRRRNNSTAQRLQRLRSNCHVTGARFVSYYSRPVRCLIIFGFVSMRANRAGEYMLFLAGLKTLRSFLRSLRALVPTFYCCILALFSRCSRRSPTLCILNVLGTNVIIEERHENGN